MALATACGSSRATPVASANVALTGEEVAAAPVVAILAHSDVTHAVAAAHSCGGSGGFVLKPGSFGLHEEVLVTGPVPSAVASARAIGVCLERQPGVLEVTGGAMLPAPTPCTTGLICPASPSARAS